MEPYSALSAKSFISHAPGYWPDVDPAQWNDWKWQLKNRVTTLAQLEQHLVLSQEERAGVLLSGNKLSLAVTPHFFQSHRARQSRLPDPETSDPAHRGDMDFAFM